MSVIAVVTVGARLAVSFSLATVSAERQGWWAHHPHLSFSRLVFLLRPWLRSTSFGDEELPLFNQETCRGVRVCLASKLGVSMSLPVGPSNHRARIATARAARGECPSGILNLPAPVVTVPPPPSPSAHSSRTSR